MNPSKTKNFKLVEIQPEKILPKLPPLPKVQLTRPLLSLVDMGVEVINTPSGEFTVQNTSEVFNKLYKKGKKFNVKMKFSNEEFGAESPLFKSTDRVSGAYRPEQRQIDVNTKLDKKTYQFLLAHEIGHSLGIGNTQEDEYRADAFANDLYPNSMYSYKNNPYLKHSWQKGYIPPNPLPVFKAPN